MNESPPADLFITSRLDTRPDEGNDYRGDSVGLQTLVAEMETDPDAVLPRFVDMALELTGTATGGLSLYERDPTPGAFRWQALRGRLEPFNGLTTPRDFSPCGVTLDANAPVLTLHPERFYDWLAKANCVFAEVLLVPLYIRGNAPLGTLWVVSDQEGHFTRRHARMLSELAAFVGVAVRLRRTEENLRSELNEQALIANEMSHRVRNVFAMARGLIRMGGKLAGSKEELVESLSARLNALAKAHALIGRSLEDGGNINGSLHELLSQVVMPFEGYTAAEHSRAELTGPHIACGDHAITSLALMFHELATNSHKYGALSSSEGRVRIQWVNDNGDLALNWTETGGPPIQSPPQRSGFGSTLLDSMVKQLGGSIEYHWPRQGVAIALRLPLQRLQL